MELKIGTTGIVKLKIAYVAENRKQLDNKGNSPESKQDNVHDTR